MRYYIIAQAAKFVPPGSVRITSNQISKFQKAFETPTGKKSIGHYKQRQHGCSVLHSFQRKMGDYYLTSWFRWDLFLVRKATCLPLINEAYSQKTEYTRLLRKLENGG